MNRKFLYLMAFQETYSKLSKNQLVAKEEEE